MDLTTWRETGYYFKYKSKHRIFYRESANDKDVLLLLHGFPTASWDWNKVWDPLSKKFHLLTLDFIGFGFSDKPRSYNYSIHDQADLVEAFLKQKKQTKVHILCHDFGDMVMQELLARYIEGASVIEYGSICMLNGGILPRYHKPLPIQNALMSPLGVLMTPFLNKKKLKNSFSRIFGKQTQPSNQELNDFYSLIDFNNGKYIFHKLIRYMAERETYELRWVGALQNCPVPLGMINGNADPISGKHVSVVLKEKVPNCIIYDLETIGHYPQTESPELVLESFLDFCII